MMKKSALLSVLLLLAACEAGPDYERPSVETPPAYKETGEWQKAEPMDAVNRGAWWEVYNDPILDALEKQVEVSNQNLKAAEAAYRDASAIVDESTAALFPTLTLNAAGTYSGTGQKGVPTTKQYNLNGQAAWTPDIWGGIRRSIETDEANAQASAAQIASARLSAQGTLATAYFDLRCQDELQRLLDATVADDKKSLQITQNQYEAGIAAKADVLAAQTQLEGVQATAINTGVNRGKLEHAIAVLIGKPPAEFELEPEKSIGRVPNIPVGIPSELLQRRPDVASSERAMAAANAQIGVADAAWFPSLTLSGQAGYMGTAISKLLQASNSFWTVGPALAETIFDAGARESVVEQSKALYDESVGNYRQTVLTAFQQVEDDLVTLRVLADQQKVETQTVADARKSEQLTLNQYQEGIVPYSSVLTAQATRLVDEESDLTVLDQRLDASVALIQALGGGWDVTQTKVDEQKAEDAPDASKCSFFICF